ncbi:hypothetical protein L228DRAFT_175625 [Xylona heveae TC161]|uniref:[histone H3]-trimethyl-L-lysine(9) demethylase n=1 Tax=Xylona heveae (strain CBS 132557 / TC161) TaxID=1328760 RepID=A0A165AKB6_XYLHT|nr:hypothetical protein L228DRAFT_175625 [Xylona heveae TC161]KZF20625.1 hypothetical protein L228DRAFT_175625 [Xylona heveae TC161]
MADPVTTPQKGAHEEGETKTTLTPPASEETDNFGASSSELSDLELEDDDIGEIEPDHYYGDGKIPVFKPTMDQFRSFRKFIDKVDKYGMKSGIIKVIPPKEWRDSLPALDESIKSIKIRNPIEQDFAGGQGRYTQANMEKQRSYNLPQWKALCEESNHQPPAKRGERRRNQDRFNRGRPGAADSPEKKRRATKTTRAKRGRSPSKVADSTDDTELQLEVPPTPTSPSRLPAKSDSNQDIAEARVKTEMTDEQDDDIMKSTKPGRQPKSISSRRRNNRRDAADVVDEAAFEDFNYRMENLEEFTPERCAELEASYWKSLTFNKPMYGADMPGSLFDDSTTSWNVSKLENLLDVLGSKVPGVNTTYLYLGMWKASFAWHLEDVDLYSINYIHFGAPKQWYSISQEDARRFEAAMRSIWPNDAKQCSQFLRHKTYLISPSLLQSQFNIKVNRLVHHEGEFVITYPYGYHSGFNLGYNCAESVNFATENWLEYGRIAKKCDCEADSVWVDVGEIERKLRGEKTPELYEETDEELDEGEEMGEDAVADLPTPPGSVGGKPKQQRGRKRKRSAEGAKGSVKKVKVRVKVPAKEPCVLCPNDMSCDELLPTDNGKSAHRLCATYIPETYVSNEGAKEAICGVVDIDKARLSLKCNFCRSKRGACFQCSQKKCTRAYHATCAAAAGVQVDIGMVPVFGEDGVEYADIGIDFRCRFHRVKRGKNVTGEMLEEDSLIKEYASSLQAQEVIQMQLYQGEIFAGVVVENRKDEEMVLVDLLPGGGRMEVEYKWILVLNPSDSQLSKPSANAKPLPSNMAKPGGMQERHGPPKVDDAFCDPDGPYVWSEFNTAEPERNSTQAKVDFEKPNQIWHYLGKTSTEARAQYTENPAKELHNPTSNFLESVKPPPMSRVVAERRSFPATHPSGSSFMPRGGTAALNNHQRPISSSKDDRQKKSEKAKVLPQAQRGYSIDAHALQSQREFQRDAEKQKTLGHDERSRGAVATSSRQPVAQTAPAKPTLASRQPSFPSSPGLTGKGHQSSSRPHPPLPAQGRAPMANMEPGPSVLAAADANKATTEQRVAGPHVNVSGAKSKHPLAVYPYLRNSYENHTRKYSSPYHRGDHLSSQCSPSSSSPPTPVHVQTSSPQSYQPLPAPPLQLQSHPPPPSYQYYRHSPSPMYQPQVQHIQSQHNRATPPSTSLAHSRPPHPPVSYSQTTTANGSTPIKAAVPLPHYQTPQQFDQQVQRASTLPQPHGASYEAFFAGLKSAAGSNGTRGALNRDGLVAPTSPHHSGTSTPAFALQPSRLVQGTPLKGPAPHVTLPAPQPNHAALFTTPIPPPQATMTVPERHESHATPPVMSAGNVPPASIVARD